MVAEQDRDRAAPAAELGQGAQALTRQRVGATLLRPNQKSQRSPTIVSVSTFGLERPHKPGKPPAPLGAVEPQVDIARKIGRHRAIALHLGEVRRIAYVMIRNH